jgi:hypothetical protein
MGVYIINSIGVAYHQPHGLYIITPRACISSTLKELHLRPSLTAVQPRIFACGEDISRARYANRIAAVLAPITVLKLCRSEKSVAI